MPSNGKSSKWARLQSGRKTATHLSKGKYKRPQTKKEHSLWNHFLAQFLCPCTWQLGSFWGIKSYQSKQEGYHHVKKHEILNQKAFHLCCAFAKMWRPSNDQWNRRRCIVYWGCTHILPFSYFLSLLNLNL